MFSIKLHYSREFTKFPRRKYVKGKVKYIDLLYSDILCVHEIDEIMEELHQVEEDKLLYYHFIKPLSDLNVGSYTLASNSDINQLSTFVANNKLIDVYNVHGKTMLHTYFVSPTQVELG